MNNTTDQAIRSISCIGSGNIAIHITNALYAKGIAINCIYSRNIKNAKELAKSFNHCVAIDNINALVAADMVILAIPDNALLPIAKALPFTPDLLVHVSGSTHIDILKPYAKEYGVFYPLQSFSKKIPVDFKEIPFCIEASNREIQYRLIALAKTLSSNIQVMDSNQRQIIHLSAVFAANFVNYLYVEAFDILNNHNINPSILTPLIKNTFHKILTIDPKKGQTGPALRNDKNTIEKHLQLLSYDPDKQSLYKLLSQSIYNTFSKENSDEIKH